MVNSNNDTRNGKVDGVQLFQRFFQCRYLSLDGVALFFQRSIGFAVLVRFLVFGPVPVCTATTKYISGVLLLITVHPSFLLRVPKPNKDNESRRFVTNLKLARPLLRST